MQKEIFMGSLGKTKKWKIVLLLVCLSVLAMAFTPPAESYCWFVTDQTGERTLAMGNIGIEIGGRFGEEGAREGADTANEAAPETEDAVGFSESQENAPNLPMSVSASNTGSSENENNTAPDAVSSSDSATVEDTIVSSSKPATATTGEDKSKVEDEPHTGTPDDSVPESVAASASSSQPVAAGGSLPSYYSPAGTIPKEEAPSLPE